MNFGARINSWVCIFYIINIQYFEDGNPIRHMMQIRKDWAWFVIFTKVISNVSQKHLHDSQYLPRLFQMYPKNIYMIRNIYQGYFKCIPKTSTWFAIFTKVISIVSQKHLHDSQYLPRLFQLYPKNIYMIRNIYQGYFNCIPKTSTWFAIFTKVICEPCSISFVKPYVTPCTLNVNIVDGVVPYKWPIGIFAYLLLSFRRTYKAPALMLACSLFLSRWWFLYSTETEG